MPPEVDVKKLVQAVNSQPSTQNKEDDQAVSEETREEEKTSNEDEAVK